MRGCPQHLYRKHQFVQVRAYLRKRLQVWLSVCRGQSFQIDVERITFNMLHLRSYPDKRPDGTARDDVADFGTIVIGARRSYVSHLTCSLLHSYGENPLDLRFIEGMGGGHVLRALRRFSRLLKVLSKWPLQASGSRRSPFVLNQGYPYYFNGPAVAEESHSGRSNEGEETAATDVAMTIEALRA